MKMSKKKRRRKKDQKNKARGKMKIFNVASRYLQQIANTLTFNAYKLQGIVCIIPLLLLACHIQCNFLRKQLKIFSKMDFYYMFGEH